MTAERIVAEARRWIGTPYLHQASTHGAGCDCLGLLRAVWRELYGDEPRGLPVYTADWDEVGRKDYLRDAAHRFLDAASGPLKPGDVLLFRLRRGAVAKHLGIVSAAGDAPRFIHAYSGHGVVENALSEPWQRRIDTVFTFPPIS